jgi:DNA-binding NarL/FixJ family response regulator
VRPRLTAWDDSGLADELLVGVVADESLGSRVARVLLRENIPLVARTSTPAALVGACEDRQPHVVVQAWATPADGAAAAREIAAAMARTRIVAILPELDRRAVRAALAAGAEGVVIAAHMVMTLPVVVRSVWRGQASVPREAIGRLDGAPLSHREREVLALAGEGRSNADIAAALFVTESTVKSHLSSVFSKLGINSREEAREMLEHRPHVPEPVGSRATTVRQGTGGKG